MDLFHSIQYPYSHAAIITQSFWSVNTSLVFLGRLTQILQTCNFQICFTALYNFIILISYIICDANLFTVHMYICLKINFIYHQGILSQMNT